MGMVYGGESYLFSKNLQGDVIGIYNDNGVLVAKYEYNAFGEITAITNASGTDVSNNASHIANINPFRYRSYYYDTDTGFYYLQSRYYDPEVGRFISQDVLVDSRSFVGLNLFTYCWNNPVNMFDEKGYYAATLVLSPPLIADLSAALGGIMTGISSSIASIKTAIATSWLVPICIAATLIAINGIVYVVNKVSDLFDESSKVISSVKSKINSGGVNPKKLRDNTVYVITKKVQLTLFMLGARAIMLLENLHTKVDSLKKIIQ